MVDFEYQDLFSVMFCSHCCLTSRNDVQLREAPVAHHGPVHDLFVGAVSVAGTSELLCAQIRSFWRFGGWSSSNDDSSLNRTRRQSWMAQMKAGIEVHHILLLLALYDSFSSSDVIRLVLCCSNEPFGLYI